MPRKRKPIDGNKEVSFLVTQGHPIHGWPEFYGRARTAGELRDDVEDILSEGEHAADDIGIWERVELPEGEEIPKGHYLIAICSKKSEEPYGIYESAYGHDTILAGLRHAREEVDKQDCLTIWKNVEVVIETEVRVTAVMRADKARRRRIA